MSRILVLGGMGMLGHRLASTLAARNQVAVTLRDAGDAFPRQDTNIEIFDNLDLRDTNLLRSELQSGRWQVVVNAAGVIKHRLDSRSTDEMIAINSLLPHTVAGLCVASGARFIHFSTDCVFSGSPGSRRGPDGYRLDDPPDARDPYGLSKLLGEVALPGCLTIRTSLIGRELRGHYGLLDWYLGQDADSVRGFSRALFTGITTPVAARLVEFLVHEQAGLDGLWHVSGAPISKHDLLNLVRHRYRRGPSIVPDHEFFCDRRLDGKAFHERTGWQAPEWPVMIEELAGEESSCAS